MRIANVKTLCMIRMVPIAKLHMKLGNLEDAVTIITICIEETVRNLKNSGRVRVTGFIEMMKEPTVKY